MSIQIHALLKKSTRGEGSFSFESNEALGSEALTGQKISEPGSHIGQSHVLAGEEGILENVLNLVDVQRTIDYRFKPWDASPTLLKSDYPAVPPLSQINSRTNLICAQL
jgi:hypothetical protein